MLLATRALAAILASTAAFAAAPLLVQKPTVNRTHVVFALAGDLWEVPRTGGDARRLTSGAGTEAQPVYSPDGAWIAFTGEYDGNYDVFVLPAGGGMPARLTWHPGEDVAVGWSPDSKFVLFRSRRESPSRLGRLFKTPRLGGPAEALPLPTGAYGAYSPDGTRLAYQGLGFRRPMHFYDSWRRYRGGEAPEVWIADLADSSIVKVPRTDSVDQLPMWFQQRVYFLSDRSGRAALWSYDPASRKVELAHDPGPSPALKWASAGPDVIALEQFGQIALWDPKTRKSTPVAVRVGAETLEARSRLERAGEKIRSFHLSPSGARAVFEARGDVLSVPAEKGDARNLTRTPGTHERTPAWSPDGKWIAYWSDASGEYQLHLRAPDGLGEERKVRIDAPAFFYEPVWSPDSKRLAFADNRLNLWTMDVETGAMTKVDSDTYYDPLGLQQLDPQWSPDSQWLAYAKLLRNHQRAVFVYGAAAGKSTQLTDGLSDARSPVWDRDGKHLYFTASTNMALRPAWLDMSSQSHDPSRAVYIAVLRKDSPSPLAPESDEEQPTAEPAKKNAGKVEVRIDFDGIAQRILALPMPVKKYRGLVAGKAGVLFVAETLDDGLMFHRFDLAKRKPEVFLPSAGGLVISANGEKCLYRRGTQYAIAATATPPRIGEGVLKTADLEVPVDPRAEWRQMYHEVWRLQRDWFYDPNFHGYNLKAAADKYAVYLEGLGSRGDLNYLFEEMLADFSVGHLYISGGQIPAPRQVPVGLLGADYEVHNGRFRFARVLAGENWNPQLRSPLTEPGVQVEEGEYLLAVNGRDVQTDREPFGYFEGLAGKQVTLRVGRDAGGAGARNVVVVPVESEVALRLKSWIDGNRRYVDQRSRGRLAYVYLPNTGVDGYQYFNRYFFAQVDKDGAVIDERYNGGGQAADYVVDYLRRPLLNYWTTRYGEDFSTPQQAIHGPKVMIVNESAGSGGDALPWYFRKLKIGPLVGKRTWGGLVGILGFPALIDGGAVTAPNMAFWTPQGADGKPAWEVENRGVAPDIEVELDPREWRQGRDAQLERAIDTALALLEKQPHVKPQRPAYPNYNGGAASVSGGGAR